MKSSLVAAIVLTLATTSPHPAAGQTSKKNPQHTDPRNGFSLVLPYQKGQLKHWTIEMPKPKEDQKVRLICDYGKPMEILVFAQAADLGLYDVKKHADSYEESIRKYKKIKTVIRRKFGMIKKFGAERINAGNLVLDVETEEKQKYEYHFYLMRSQRNKWIYTIMMVMEPGLLKKKTKERLGQQLDFILSSFRTFPIKDK